MSPILFISQTLGLDTPTIIPMFQMMIRGVIVFFLGIFITRFNKALISIQTPFNFILFIMLGSIFAATIMDADLFIPFVVTIIFLMLLNFLITMCLFYFPSIELLIKGSPAILVENGKLQYKTMKKNFITKRELYNELYLQLHTDDINKVKLAILESNGAMHFIKKK